MLGLIRNLLLKTLRTPEEAFALEAFHTAMAEAGLTKSNRSHEEMMRSVFGGIGQAGIPKPTNEADLLKTYEREPWVFAAVNAVATAVSSFDYQMVFDDEEEEPIPDEHWTVRLLKKPNPRLTLGRTLQEIVGYRMLGGDAYVAVETSEDAIAPDELWVLPGTFVRAVPSASALIDHYEVSAFGRRVPYSLTELVHISSFRPSYSPYGMGFTQPAAEAIGGQYASASYGRNLMQRGGVPPFILQGDEMLIEEQRDELKAAWHQQKDDWLKKGIPPVLFGVVAKSIANSTKDMQYAELRELNREDILAAANVPPGVVGVLKHLNYNTFRTQMELFIYNNASPQAGDICESFTCQLFSPLTEGTAKLVHSVENNPWLKEPPLQRAQRHQIQILSGTRTINETRAEDGKEPFEEDWANMPAKPGAVPSPAAAGGSQAPPASASNEDPPESPAEQETRAAAELYAKSVSVQALDDALPSMRAMGHRLAALTLPLRINAAEAGAEDVVASAKGAGVAGIVSKRQLPLLIDADAVFELGEDELAVQALEAFGLDQSVVITETLVRRVRRALVAFIQAGGADLPALAREIDSLALELVKPSGWARTVARTEVRQALGFGANETLKALGLSKVWISARDSETRELHAEADRLSHQVPVAATANFPAIDAPHPGASAHGVKENANCRCDVAVAIPGFEADEQRAYDAAVAKANDVREAQMGDDWIPVLAGFARTITDEVKRNLRQQQAA